MAKKKPTGSKFFAGAFRTFRRLRVLSLDGAGIYGLTEALLLEEMCRRDESFLTENNIALFAGCSAGAVNALVLASYERPRDAIEEGALRKLWLDERCWVPPPFPNNVQSLMGMAPWNGREEMLSALKDIFRDRRLCDLHHSVLVTTYAYSGYGNIKGSDTELDVGYQPPNWPGAQQLVDRYPWLRPYMAWKQPQPSQKLLDLYAEHPEWTRYDDPDPLAAQRSSHTMPGAVLTDSYRHWQPRLFHHMKLSDLPEASCDGEVDAAELAYAAAAPPGFRYQLGGLGDGAAFNMNPTPYAYVSLIQHLHSHVLESDMEELLPLRESDHDGSEHQLERQNASRLYEPAISVLSVGAGIRMPYMWPPDGALGMLSAQMWPVNPARRVFYPPGMMSLQGGDAGADILMRQIMGPRYARLNPPVMDMPLLVSSLLARFKPTRMRIWKEIQRRIQSSDVQRACDTVDEHFFKNDFYWAKDQVWVSAPLGPLPSEGDAEAIDAAIADRKTDTPFVSAPGTPPEGLKPI